MLKILQLLRASRSVKTFKVLDFKQGRDFYYLKLEAVLTTEEVLYIREYVSTSTINTLQKELRNRLKPTWRTC